MPKTWSPAYRFDGTPLRVGRGSRTQHEVAAAAGVSQTLVALAELGIRRPSPETLARLCAVVGCSIDSLFVPEDAE